MKYLRKDGHISMKVQQGKIKIYEEVAFSSPAKFEQIPFVLPAFLLQQQRLSFLERVKRIAEETSPLGLLQSLECSPLLPFLAHIKFHL